MREIRPLNNHGSIQLKFSYRGRRYSFNPVSGGDYSNKRDLAVAQAVATRIQNDMLAECFDSTLEKYRPQPPKPIAARKPAKPSSYLEIWDAWVDTLNLPSATKADHYEMIRRMLLKAGATPKDNSWLLDAGLAPSTFNKRLSYLKSCFRWAVDQGLVVENPFEGIKARRVIRPEIKPFTLDEMRAILQEFERCYPHYTSFVLFLFMTGVRTSEAIGLRWRHIDFHRKEFVIRESLPKDRTGNGYRRVQKETKSGSVRYLTMTQGLEDILRRMQSDCSRPDDLVFRSAKGCVIDASNFREDWKAVLLNIGVEYRKPYTTRHTLLSHAIEQGIPLTGVAYIAGHSDTRMVMQTYGHMIHRPCLPDIPI